MSSSGSATLSTFFIKNSFSKIRDGLNIRQISSIPLEPRRPTNITTSRRGFISRTPRPRPPLMAHRLTWPGGYDADPMQHYPPWIGPVTTAEEASSLVKHLGTNGRQLIAEQLRIVEESEQHDDDSSRGETLPTITPVTSAQLYRIFLFNGLPFIAFGVLDNGIMIVAGEYIDLTIGAALGISTMAAAALGNLVSDVAGVGTAGYVELLVSRVGVTPIELTAGQTLTRGVRWTVALGRAIGISIGCVIGMLPLLFFSNKEDAADKSKEGESKVDPVSAVIDKTLPSTKSDK